LVAVFSVSHIALFSSYKEHNKSIGTRCKLSICRDLLHPILVTALLYFFGFIEVQGNYEAASPYTWSKEFSELRKTCV